MTLKMTRSAEVRAASYDETDNSVEVVWTTGAAVRRYDYRNERPYQEVLVVTPQSVRLDRLNSGAPFLNSHDSSDLSAVIGSVIPGSARIEGGKGLARIKLSGAPGDADLTSKIRDGIIRSVSVGYVVHAIQKSISDDRDDVWRVVDWEPFELSAVAVPADPDAHVRGLLSEENEFDPVKRVTPVGTIESDDLDEDTAAAVRFAVAAASVRGAAETPAQLAEWVFTCWMGKTRSTMLAGIAYGAALALATDPEALARAAANSNIAPSKPIDTEDLSETRFWPLARPR